MAVLSRGQITIVDLNDAKALQCFLQSNKGDSQLYDPASKAYTPNFTSSSLVITPKIYETGNASTLEAKCSNFKWTIDGSALYASGTASTVVSGGNSNTNIGCSVSASTGALTISKNIIKDNLSLTFECDYTDSGLTTHLSAQKTIIRTSAASTLFQAVITQPKGDTFDKTIASTATLEAECHAYHGANACTAAGTTYTWKSLDLSDGTWKAVTSGVSSITNGSKLTVSRDDVLNFQTFKCIVVDGEDTSKTCESIVTFRDMTDPYTIDIVSPSGNVIKNGSGSITLNARVYMGTELIESESTAAANRKFTYTWKKYNANGVAANFYGTSSSSKTGNPLTVTNNDVDNKATFFCEIEKK